MTAASERPSRESAVKCSSGDLSADDLDKLVDQLCSPSSKFPYENPIYLSQVALLELAKRLRAPALSEEQLVALEWGAVCIEHVANNAEPESATQRMVVENDARNAAILRQLAESWRAK